MSEITRYNIIPISKPRQTRADKWKKRPPVMRYRAFADEIKLKKVVISNGATVLFGMPMPPSWSKQKKEIMENQPHQQKPDIDNLLKALLDALYKDDSHIWHIRTIKRWSREGYIEVST